MDNKTYIFIDASNIWQAQKAKGFMFDYKKLKQYLEKQYSDIKIFYYTAYPGIGTRDYDLKIKHDFFTFLKKGLHFELRKKELKRIHVSKDSGYKIQEKGNMDVEITIDVIHSLKEYKTAILFTGDSDFLALLKYLKKNDKTVYVYSSKNNISQELRSSADSYIDVLNIEEDIWGNHLEYKK